MSERMLKMLKLANSFISMALTFLMPRPSSPKTVFFWAPAFKWSLVIAGLGDIARPAEKLSGKQSTSLAATGTIWSRYSLVIIPKNWALFSVNVFVALTGFYQLGRIYNHEQEQKAKAIEAPN
ncbi:unnamed protein product, partial [Meganyctiphanes norvegica]